MQITTEDYHEFKPLLFSLGYRMLGSITEVEDSIQETFLKAYQIDTEDIDNKKAYLCKIMTNRCLDVLKSARYKREQYIGPWNPEPLLIDQPASYDPAESILQKEGLSIAYLRMMEFLRPEERAVLLLREVFNFTYLEIAAMIDKKEENCRKMFSRAKQKMAPVQDESLDYKNNKSIIDRFIQAFQTQDQDVLLELISDKVTLHSDGGGKVNAATRPIISAPNVLNFLYGIMKKMTGDFDFEVKMVNYQPGILIFIQNQLQSVFSFYIYEGKINEMYITLNPDKLRVQSIGN
ncbi:RNA polymerase sigma-70 factor [Gracilibacillus kekensis]|uniref:RNA polymerase sigma-70 factor, ECF subfamily n=1 Tax=Gracilibacillus kekensis TaxID=1027249 RepID=A0A1M7L5T4_9BACI|nr:RNA polymerase sigma-70 factor [Gracilibacillus kekensis]SHM73253.1 RNA polymerase sigma-70 factor, ECF subfamily [Gracilibacillus kekensis]